MNAVSDVSSTSNLCRALLLGVFAMLCACGGTVSQTGSPEVPLPNGPVAVPPATGPTELLGVYSASAGTQELLSIATPADGWFAVYFEKPTANPAILSGPITRGVNGAAAIDNLRAFQFAKSPVPVSGSASITDATLSAYRLAASGVTSASNAALIFTSTALGVGTYNLAKAASLGDVQGSPSWQGVWYDGSSSNQSVLQISANGQISNLLSLNSCDLTSLTLQPLAGANMFKVTLHIPIKSVGGICARTKDQINGVNLNGVAVIYKSPLAGSTSRLDLIVVDSTGSGISFRGDR